MNEGQGILEGTVRTAAEVVGWIPKAMLDLASPKISETIADNSHQARQRIGAAVGVVAGLSLL
jgi:hypothetical protein